MASEQRHRCEECGGELTCCGPMTEDGPLLDCLLCQRSEIITKLKAQLAASEAKRKVLGAEARKARAILGPFGTLRDGIIQEDGLMYEDARRATDAAKAMEAP